MQAEGSVSKLEQLTARLSRMSLSQSFSALQRQGSLARRSSLGSLGSPVSSEAPPPLPSVLEQQPTEAAALPWAGSSAASEGEEAPCDSPGHLVGSARSGSSHFEQWRTVLQAAQQQQQQQQGGGAAWLRSRRAAARVRQAGWPSCSRRRRRPSS